ncbi:MAG: hypothetical protein ABEJ23_09200 [Haloarculaceae archaeon]
MGLFGAVGAFVKLGTALVALLAVILWPFRARLRRLTGGDGSTSSTAD